MPSWPREQRSETFYLRNEGDHMIPAIYSRLAAAALIGAVSANATRAENGLTAVSMRSDDGIYLVNVMTQRGDCNKNYQWMIMVSGGRVSDTPMAASGQITSRG